MTKRIRKSIKAKVRKDFIEQGGYDGRFAPRIIPDKKKKYNRRKAKRIAE